MIIFLKRPLGIIITIIMVGIVVGIVARAVGGGAPTYETARATRGNLIQEVSVT